MRYRDLSSDRYAAKLKIKSEHVDRVALGAEPPCREILKDLGLELGEDGYTCK